MGVCAWAWVSAAPLHFWLGCQAVCVSVRTPSVARHSWLGFVSRRLGVAWHLFTCRGSLRVLRIVRVVPCSPMPKVASVNQVPVYPVCSHQVTVCLVDHVLHGICPNVMTFGSQRRAVAS